MAVVSGLDVVQHHEMICHPAISWISIETSTAICSGQLLLQQVVYSPAVTIQAMTQSCACTCSIVQLAQLLDPARAGRADKLSTLADAVKEITRLRTDTAALQRLNKVLEVQCGTLSCLGSHCMQAAACCRWVSSRPTQQRHSPQHGHRLMLAHGCFRSCSHVANPSASSSTQERVMDLKARQQYPPDMVPQLPAPPMAFMQQLQQMQAAAQMQATVQQQLQASQPQQQPQMQAQQSQPQPTAPHPQQPQQQPPQMQPLMQPQMPQPGEKCSTACPLSNRLHALPAFAVRAPFRAASILALLLPNSDAADGKCSLCPPACYARSQILLTHREVAVWSW